MLPPRGGVFVPAGAACAPCPTASTDTAITEPANQRAIPDFLMTTPKDVFQGARRALPA